MISYISLWHGFDGGMVWKIGKIIGSHGIRCVSPKVKVGWDSVISMCLIWRCWQSKGGGSFTIPCL